MEKIHGNMHVFVLKHKSIKTCLFRVNFPSSAYLHYIICAIQVTLYEAENSNHNHRNR